MAAGEAIMARDTAGCSRGILAMALIFGALVSCRSTRAPVIAVVPETTAREVWESEHAGAERAAKRLGWDIYWNGPSREDDVERQIQIVNGAIARHVSGLILSPDHAVALISPVRSALSQDIPTVIVGSPLGIVPGGKLSFVVNDDAAMGRLVTERLLPHLKPGDVVAILGVNPNLLGQIERTSAIESSLHEALPSVQVIERRSTSFDFSEAEETAEETIRATPNLRAVIALNIIETRAASFAISGSPTPRSITLIGCDQDLDLVRQVRAGSIDALIAENTSVMGYDAIDLIASQRSGKSTETMRVVPPILVTRENVDRPDVQQVLDMNWRAQ
jgi:ribose transport system substrate-binding protein